MRPIGSIYEFVFRGLLAQEALDKAGRQGIDPAAGLDQEVAARLPIGTLDESLVASARQMATVYTAVAAFENSARKLISTVLLDQIGQNWWDQNVSAAIKRKVEVRRAEEAKVKWHTQRGAAPISYTDFGDLGNIIGQNWNLFEPYIPSLEWVKSIFDVIERSRNVIMHSGSLEIEDVERIGINIRDWIKQVGV
jgi:hypothetical protein